MHCHLLATVVEHHVWQCCDDREHTEQCRHPEEEVKVHHMANTKLLQISHTAGRDIKKVMVGVLCTVVQPAVGAAQVLYVFC